MTHRCSGAHTVSGVIANGRAVRQNQPLQGDYLSVGRETRRHLLVEVALLGTQLQDDAAGHLGNLLQEGHT